MDIEVTRDVMEQMFRAAANAHPNEACGILLGKGANITAFQPTKNVHPTPETHFEIDPAALIQAHKSGRDGALSVLGYFHSHPVGAATPSSTDTAMASGDARIWAIIAKGDVTFWVDLPSGFAPLSYRLGDR